MIKGKHYKAMPPDASEDHWTKHFIQMALNVAHYSHDPITKVGMVITAGRTPIAWGHNRFGKDVPNKAEWWEKGTKKLRTIHAEVDAVGMAARYGRSTEGAFIYGTLFPCNNCALSLIAAGIMKITCQKSHYPSDSPRFLEPLQRFKEAGVEVVLIEYPKPEEFDYFGFENWLSLLKTLDPNARDGSRTRFDFRSNLSPSESYKKDKK